MKKLAIFTLTVLIIGCATNPFSGNSDYELTNQYRQESEIRAGQYCKERLLLAREIHRRDKSSPSKESIKNREELYCAWSKSRWNDAYTWLRLIEKNSGSSFGQRGFYIAYMAGHYTSAINRLESIAELVDHKEITNLSPRSFWGFIRKLDSNELIDIEKRTYNAMINSPHIQRLDPYFRSSIANLKLYSDAKDGIFEKSDNLIAYVISPNTFIEMLADKQLEPLWPNIEQKAGENLTFVNNQNISEAMALYNKDPTDLEAYSKVAHALLFSGKFKEVIAFVKIPSSHDLPFITEHEAWALNMKVNALDAISEHDAASEIFESISSIPKSDFNGWLVNFTVNRASRLMRQGDWQLSLDAAIYADEFKGSDYAKMLIREAKACALYNLSMKSEASVILDQISKFRADGYVSASRAMLCSNREETAVEIALEALNSDKHRTQMLHNLQEQRFSLYHSNPKHLDIHRLLKTSSTLRATFEKYGRLIPSEFIPIAGLKRN